MLSDSQIAKFQKIYEQRFGEKINRDEALNLGVELINLVKLIYRPIKKDEISDKDNNR